MKIVLSCFIYLLYLFPLIVYAQSKFNQPTVLIALNVLDCVTCIYATKNINSTLNKWYIKPTYLLYGISEKGAADWLEQQFGLSNPGYMIDNDLFLKLSHDQRGRIVVIHQDKVLYSELITKADEHKILQLSVNSLKPVRAFEIDTNISVEFIYSMQFHDSTIIIHENIFKKILSFDLKSGKYLATFNFPNDLYTNLYRLAYQDSSSTQGHDWKEELHKTNISLLELNKVEVVNNKITALIQANFLNPNGTKVVPEYFLLQLDVSLKIENIIHIKDPPKPYFLKTWAGFLISDSMAVFSVDKGGRPGKPPYYLGEWEISGNTSSFINFKPFKVEFKSSQRKFTASRLVIVPHTTYHYFDRWPVIYNQDENIRIPEGPKKINVENDKFKICKIVPSVQGIWIIYWKEFNYYLRHFDEKLGPSIKLEFGEPKGSYVTFDNSGNSLYAIWAIHGKKGGLVFELPQLNMFK